MQTSAQVKRELTINVINRVGCHLTQEQIQELKSALDIELYRLNLSKESTELVTYDETYVSILDSFIIAKRIEGRAESTLKRYRDIIIMMLHFFNKPVDNITTEDIRYYLAWYTQNRKVQAVTLDGMRLCICSFFIGFIRSNILQVIQLRAYIKLNFRKK